VEKSLTINALRSALAYRNPDAGVLQHRSDRGGWGWRVQGLTGPSCGAIARVFLAAV